MQKPPILRPLIALIAGILLQWYSACTLVTLLSVLGVVAVVWSAYGASSLSANYRYRWFTGIFPLLLFALVGMLSVFAKDVRNRSQWFGRHLPAQAFRATVVEVPLERQKTFRLLLEVQQAFSRSQSVITEGKILAYLPKDSTVENMDVGDTLLFAGQPQRITGFGNPGGFDYGQYCGRQQIYFQVFLREGHFKIIPNRGHFSFGKMISQWQKWILRQLQRHITHQPEQGLAEALLIGYKNDLDAGLVNAYTATGVVHIIAISGGHLAVIYLLLNALFARLQRRQTGIWVSCLLIVFLVWLFAFLSGLSASIVRAAIMISITLMGKVWGKGANTLNSLAVSAFLMLLWNPFWLWDAGFWLSFTAVLGIVLLQRPILNLAEIENPLLFRVWQMTALTLSAQVFTWPVVLYVFHQFPLWFLFSNLLVIPLSSCVLTGEIILVWTSIVPPLAAIVGKVVEWGIWLMNQYILNLDSLPVKNWTVGFGFWQMILCFAIMVLVLAGWGQKKRKYLLTALVMVCCVFGLSIYDYGKNYSRERLIVYNVPHVSAMDWIMHNKAVFVGEKAVLQDGFIFQNTIQPARIFYHADLNRDQVISPRSMSIGKYRVWVLDQERLQKITSYAEVDILILQGKIPFSMQDLRDKIKFSTIVFDSSVPMWKIEKWKKDGSGLPLRFHSVSESGAFIVE